MKKVNLSIPKPCHENWDAMTSAERGRFCSSCQKVVVDFTNMSDRQLAEFFKKPVSHVCGRLHPDQLNRDIILPKKRISWIKYFFSVTWPAFVLFLKSCTNDKVVGAMAVKVKEVKIEKSPAILGGIGITSITPADTLPEMELKLLSVATVTTVGELRAEIIPDAPDSVVAPVVIEPPDTAHLSQCSYLGEVAVNADSLRVDTIRNVEPLVDQSSPVKKEDEVAATSFKVFPNPVHSGGALTITFSENKPVPREIVLLSASGQKIVAMKIAVGSDTINFPLPQLTEGIYFIELITKNRETESQQIMVIK